MADAGPAAPTDLLPGAPVVMAYSSVGAGSVFVTGDSDLWTDIDYDADGITATALLINFFSEPGVPISYYIPNRLEEGYSLNPPAIKKLAESGVRLIITVDCGISNRQEIELAKGLGMKLVVTDHHQIPEDFDPLGNHTQRILHLISVIDEGKEQTM